MTACFIGHASVENAEKVEKKLCEVYENLITLGYDEFLFGARGDFDYLAHSVGRKFKERGAKIKLVYCYENSAEERKGSKYVDESEYDECRLLDFYDKTWKTIFYRNIAMMKASDITIFYVGRTENSSSFKLLSYAKSKDIRYLNIY